MTHKDIAKLVNVSPSTVSKALAGSKEINAETIAAIKKIADEAGYFTEKKNHKKRTTKNMSPTVAILCPEVISPYYASIVTGLQNEVEKFNGKTATYICGFNANKINEYIKFLEKQEAIDAIVCFHKEAYVENISVPILYMSQIAKTIKHDAVFFNIYDAVEMAVKHLKELGHKNIGYIGEINTSSSLDAFKSVMSAEGLSLEEKYIYVIKERFAEIGYKAAELIIQTKYMPTAFIAAYDEIALGAIRDLKSGGISIPRDISFVGLNDSPASSYGETPLTTIRYHIEEQCAIAAKLLETKIFNLDYKTVQHILVQNELIIRQTTAPPNSNNAEYLN